MVNTVLTLSFRVDNYTLIKGNAMISEKVLDLCAYKIKTRGKIVTLQI